MLALIAAIVGSGLYPPRIGDPDIRTYGELATTLVFFTAVPLLAITSVLFAPLMWLWRRYGGWGGWGGTRLANGIIGASLALPTVAIIAAIGTLIGTRTRGPVPLDWLVLLAFGGLVFGLTLPDAGPGTNSGPTDRTRDPELGTPELGTPDS